MIAMHCVRVIRVRTKGTEPLPATAEQRANLTAWVAALTDGTRTQGAAWLRVEGRSGTCECCLGVAVDLTGTSWACDSRPRETFGRPREAFVVTGVCAAPDSLYSQAELLDGERQTKMPPSALMKERYAFDPDGMDDFDVVDDGMCGVLSLLNDEGATFAEIAGVICYWFDLPLPAGAVEFVP